MPPSHDPIAYTYNADHHCPECAIFSGMGVPDAIDHEGNPVRVVFSWDEWWEPSIPGRQVLVCGTCENEIDEREVA